MIEQDSTKSQRSDTGKTTTAGLSRKGLNAGSIGLIGIVVLAISVIAPAYTLTGALGPTVSEVGVQLPAIFIVGFLPMFLVALGYRELNQAMPDNGTSFTWGVKAFGPWMGWVTGWATVTASVIVLSNLAGIAVDFFYLLLSQIFQNPELAELTRVVPLNIFTCLVFMALATWISYRGMEATKIFQYVLVTFQIIALIWFSIAAFGHVAGGSAFDATAFSFEWLNPFAVSSFSAFSAGISLSLFIFWGWDTVFTVNEESDKAEKTPGRAATLVIITVVVLYLLVAISTLSFSGVGDGEFGLGNKDIQENVFASLAGPVMGPFAIMMSLAVLSSSAASLQSTFVSPARTLMAMGHYKALPAGLAKVSPRFQSPSTATLVAALASSIFYAVMRVLSENVLWDTITSLGMMICLYYGLTALSCVWYFRKEWFTSRRNVFFKLIAPLIGGIVLLVILVQTAIDSMDPDYGSGSSLFGVGLVFILGAVVILGGVVFMVIYSRMQPGFFRGETLRQSTSIDDKPTDEGLASASAVTTDSQTPAGESPKDV